VGSERATLMDRAAIEALIPHREPFLFVDRVIDMGADTITTEWDVPADLFAFRGHYPGRPLLPGVLTSEFAFQSAAILLVSSSAMQSAPRAVPALTKIEDARFKRAVLPGETLRAAVEVIERLGSACFMKASITCGGATVLKVRFTVALVDALAGA
jgi:3-hydroxyacyl-[acyl-carrier-protein] dehydratase